ncbi:MAG: hypothetical protein CK426_07795 [Legionella sp.]|nr:MAG: hypothetical protein CK423_05640 [Legionella sp.]PJD97777.1 MAG: hypothetical protein CK426_07795 [Legionella sp.]
MHQALKNTCCGLFDDKHAISANAVPVFTCACEVLFSFPGKGALSWHTVDAQDTLLAKIDKK